LFLGAEQELGYEELSMSFAKHSNLLAGAALSVAEAGAIAAARLAGHGDEKAADQVAVDAMRTMLNAIEMRGRIVIGEGERDEAPMLYIGEEVGLGHGLDIDIALDPLEGTTLTAKAMANALAVIAFAPRGGLLHAPDVYMDKAAIGPGYPRGVIDIDRPAAENIKAVAQAKGVAPNEVSVCVMDRPRHEKLIADLRAVGARIHLITDGDVAGVINTALPQTGIDLYLGIGGAPEGVLAAAALKGVGGQMQSRLFFRNDDERGRARRIGITDLDRVYDLHDLVSQDAIFVATGVTDGNLVHGVRRRAGRIETQSIVITSADGLMRTVSTQHIGRT
jgi:fructose-1,6-bisphosphatase II / sedoheptulose-1,7-bisphosphatase